MKEKYTIGSDPYKENGDGSLGVYIGKDGAVEYFGENKTSKEWYDLNPKPTIIDPDGWDRSNYRYSFYEELITKIEFDKRRMCSTCMFIKY